MKNAKESRKNKNKEVWSNKNRKDVRVMEGQMEGRQNEKRKKGK